MATLKGFHFRGAFWPWDSGGAGWGHFVVWMAFPSFLPPFCSREGKRERESGGKADALKWDRGQRAERRGRPEKAMVYL